MTTQAEMRQRVAEDLSLVPIGQSPENQDATRIDATYDEVYQRLSEEGLAVWASDAEVPDRLTPYYALMMEEKLLTSYGVSEARATRIKMDAGDDGMKAMAKIARLIVDDHEDTQDNTDY